MFSSLSGYEEPIGLGRGPGELNSVLKGDHNVAKVTPEFEPAECSTILSSVRFKYVAYF